MIYEYLPKKKLQEYAYNNTADAKARAGKKLVTIVPNKGNPQAYNKKITDEFIKVNYLISSNFLGIGFATISITKYIMIPLNKL